MKKILWGIFFGSLLVVLFLYPDSVFATRIKDLAYALIISLIPIIPFIAAIVPGAIQTFVNEKVKGLANKQDVEELTRKVEEVRLAYAKDLENHKTENQLRFAVLERRFRAHQDAYRMCYMVVNGPTHDTKKNSEAIREWWPENCLYLDQKPRECFLEAVFGAFLIVNWDADGRSDYDEEGQKTALSETARGIKLIHKAMQSLEEAVGVPPIAGDKIERISGAGLTKDSKRS